MTDPAEVTPPNFRTLVETALEVRKRLDAAEEAVLQSNAKAADIAQQLTELNHELRHFVDPSVGQKMVRIGDAIVRIFRDEQAMDFGVAPEAE